MGHIVQVVQLSNPTAQAECSRSTDMPFYQDKLHRDDL
jgi:hypothetical protein